MALETETIHDEISNIDLPRIQGTDRPIRVEIANDGIVGISSLPGGLDGDFVALRGTEVFIPTRQAFVVAGGDLPYDVTLIIGFDGAESSLLEVRYETRP